MTVDPNPERFARYRWAARVAEGARVLDAACGTGQGTSLLAEAAAEVVGVDNSPPAIEEARREYGETVDFREGDLHELPFEEAEFDHVVCFEALAEVEEPAEALDQLRRALRPGGALMLSFPNRESYPPGNPLHRSALSTAELGRLLAERFASVAVHRQQSYFASVLGSPELLAQNDPAASVSADAAKLEGTPPGAELHAVAAASDGELPRPPAWIVLGANADWARQEELLEHWRERAVQAEAHAVIQAKKLQLLTRRLQAAQR